MEVAFSAASAGAEGEKHRPHSYFRHTCTCVHPSLNNLYLPVKHFSLIWGCVCVLQQREAGAFWCEMFVFIHLRATRTATSFTNQ